MSIRRILKELKEDKITVEEAEKRIKLFALERMGEMVKLDLGREFRRGIPEIIFAEKKDTDMLIEIILRKLEKTGKVIVSRITGEQLGRIRKLGEKYLLKVSMSGRIAVIKRKNIVEEKKGRIGIVAAGTSDLPIADEVKILAEEFGCETILIVDVGIAGLYRTIEAAKKLLENDVDVAVVIAGMEGALPSIICSLTDIPVIGLPASIGYGLGGRGISALLTMLQTCTPGLAVVNIDNSIGAAAVAALIARRKRR